MQTTARSFIIPLVSGTIATAQASTLVAALLQAWFRPREHANASRVAIA